MTNTSNGQAVDQSVKKVVDTFSRLSFMLETFVKLKQTGDHVIIANQVLEASIKDVTELAESLVELKNDLYEQE